MIAKYLSTTFIVASLSLVPAEKAAADEAAAFIGGALLGGIVGSEIQKNKQRKQQTTRRSTTTSKSYSSGISSAQRQQNREVQTALNYFGYNVGAVDGALGRNSRAGITRYQADMGYPADGYLDDHERSFLLTSYQRALASAHVPPYNQILASQGQAGLLRTYRNEQLGIATPQGATTQPQGQLAVLPQQGQTATLPQMGVQGTTARADTGGQLPSFAFAPTGKSANDLCNDTSVLTASNGGPIQASSMTNPNLALNEQFCQARVQAIAESDRLEEAVPNMTAPQIEQQCEQLTAALAPYLSGIESKSANDVIAATSTFLHQSGHSMDQLVSGGQLCLGVGYRTDNGEMALASAVLLSAAGQQGYGEVVGHQLREGIGVAKATGPQPGEWMRLALDAAQSGNTVLGQTPERLAVLNAAMSPAGASATTTLPVFQTTTGN
ncbi:peptidoglycan-binding protein [Ruegeria sediminis]|uniref:Peptidoglycan-binding protein n=1 Tax=Ruegeria sediminis TaxID=2583820 RepID=A0ABY2WZM4_9RHOB|nr:peptidoglycan-binding domain-containing protein [Ruegeria sediminis]TMV08018.1 peptidoglycan-binding protein [Ruegeria sediminis]